MFKQRLIIAVLILVIVAGTAFLGVVLVPFLKRPSGPIAYNTATLLRSIQGVSQLVTVNYIMEKVVVLEDPPKTLFGQFMTGESRVILVAHGKVKAGIDLAKITKDDLELSNQKLTIRLPPGEIMETFLEEDKTQVIEHKTGFLRKFDSSLPQLARQQALYEIKASSRQSNILVDADLRAREQLRQLFAPLGLTVEFKEK